MSNLALNIICAAAVAIVLLLGIIANILVNLHRDLVEFMFDDDHEDEDEDEGARQPSQLSTSTSHLPS